METPEKLYILFNHPHTVDYTKLNKRRYEEEVEYTRTDVVIEKAQNFFRQSHHLFKLDGMELSAFIEEFRNYMI